ncbi:protein phosphatase 2C domain-containing protein [Streptomyces sp. NPDC060131]|uniref:protein phosphatase 2C domain-containing protein n=1 Tax=unclassified Streptomyces TaxID=2593676 RepID=UPI00365E77DC
MSQQGERPADGDWWNRLYDASAPDTGPAPAAGDTLDDRFDSAADALSDPGADVDPDAVADRVSDAAGTRPEDVTPERSGAQRPAAGVPWEPAAPYAPSDARPLPGATAGSPPPTSPHPTPPAPSPRPPNLARPPDPPRPPDPRRSTPLPPAPREPATPATPPVSAARPAHTAPYAPPVPPVPPAPVTHVGDGLPTYDPEPTALPAAHADRLDEIVADTVLDGARYGAYTLRAMSVRGDSARYRGDPRRDALLTARFGEGADALVLVAVASGARATEGAHRAAADVARWIGGAVGHSHGSLSADIRAGRRGDLKSGLHRLTDRGFGKLRARAAEQGLSPGQYTADLRCLLLSADPGCRTRVFFGVGDGGLFRLRDGAWQDLEPPLADPAASTGAPVVGFGSPPPETPEGDRLTLDLAITKPPSPYTSSPYTSSPYPPSPYPSPPHTTSPHASPHAASPQGEAAPPPPPPEPFRFRASVARPGDTLLLCSAGLAEPLRGEPALARELAGRWGPGGPPDMAEFLADTQLRVKGYADDRTAVGVWEA